MRIVVAIGLCVCLSAPAMAQSVIAAVPKEMHGTWGFDPESCDEENSDTLMTVQARSVDFYASGYALRKIWRQADGAIKATATTSEEGEARKRRGAIALKLVKPDRLSVKTGRDAPHVYSRCKARGKAG
jgi:hypothetical protein